METLAQAMRRVKAATTLKEYCDARLDPRPRDGRDHYACPNPACMSGKSGRQGSDAAFHLYVNGRGEQRYKCSACGIEGDIFDLTGIIEGTDRKADQCNVVAEFAGVVGYGAGDTWRDWDGNPIKRTDRGDVPGWDEELVLGQTIRDGGRAMESANEGRKADNGANTRNDGERPRDGAESGAGIDYTAFYRQAHADLMASPEALAYLHGRGITDETMRRHMLGYVASWTHPKTGKYPTKRIIIPRTRQSYTARAIDETERYYNPKFPKQIVGTQKDVFNLKAARGADIVIVVEGELDAASITQATGYVAVGLGSITNVPTFPDKAKEAAPRAMWIVALDNDKPKEDGSNPGQEAQRKLLDGMEAAGLACYGADGAEMYGAYKDANEMLAADPSTLEANVRGIVEGIEDRARRQRMERYSVVDPVRAVRDLYELKEARPPISTGFEMLDRVLNGGLHAKSLHVIGAQSSEGKTTVTLQIADNIAESGHPVLFVTIEQRTDELIAKSLARIVYQGGGGRLPAREITNPVARKGWTDEQRQTLKCAADTYEETVAPFINFMDPDELPSVHTIEAWANVMAEQYGEPPTIFVDYLQLLAPFNERDTDKQITDKNVTALRQMAGRLNTAVWCVASLNRQSYTAPISTDSFKESGAIEYGADVLLGLEPFDLETRWYNETEKQRAVKAKWMHDRTRKADKRWMDMRVLKNRFGGLPEDGLPFVYHAPMDTFETVWKVRRAKRNDWGGGDLDNPGMSDDEDSVVM